MTDRLNLPEVPGGMKCRCGGQFFAPTPVFQTCPDGRTFELAAEDGLLKFLWILRCLTCGVDYIMTNRPHEDGGLIRLRELGGDGDEMTWRISPAAQALLDRRKIDPYKPFGPDGQEE